VVGFAGRWSTQGHLFAAVESIAGTRFIPKLFSPDDGREITLDYLSGGFVRSLLWSPDGRHLTVVSQFRACDALEMCDLRWRFDLVDRQGAPVQTKILGGSVRSSRYQLTFGWSGQDWLYLASGRVADLIAFNPALNRQRLLAENVIARFAEPKLLAFGQDVSLVIPTYRGHKIDVELLAGEKRFTLVQGAAFVNYGFVRAGFPSFWSPERDLVAVRWMDDQLHLETGEQQVLMQGFKRYWAWNVAFAPEQRQAVIGFRPDDYSPRSPTPLYLTAMDGGTAQEIPNSAAGEAIWSPDGQRLAFIGAERGDSFLTVATAAGVTLRRIPLVAWEDYPAIIDRWTRCD
jgi:hypothetical protein